MNPYELCPQCGIGEKKLSLKDLTIFTCKHSFTNADLLEQYAQIREASIQKSTKTKYHSISGEKEAYPYQKVGVDFILQSEEQNKLGGIRCLVADDMGLGKTVQALLALRNGVDKIPALVIVKSATTINWMRETLEWFSDEDFAVYVIQGTAQWIPAGYSVYILSMDSLGRNVPVDEWSEVNRKFISKKLVRSKCPLYQIGWKTVVVDECQAFKETSTTRYQALKCLISECGIENIIPMSGTPIKNRADEFFPALHFLRPDVFPFMEHFKRYWLTQDDKGRWSRIKRNKLGEFRKLTADFMIRRDRSILNLPAHTHNYSVIEIQDIRVKEAYNKQLEIFRIKVENGECNDPINKLAELAKLRRITGMAKAPFALEFCEEFFASAESDHEENSEYPVKLTIGVHHHDVVDYMKLLADKHHRDWNILSLTGHDDALQKDRIIESFRQPERKLLVCSTLAGGVGMNIQFCANYLILESEWSPADEEQFIGRFHRNGQSFPVMGTTLVCAGTVDDFFEEIKKTKRKIFGETISGWSLTADKSSLNQLVNATLAGRL